MGPLSMKQTAPQPELGTFTKFPNQMKSDASFSLYDKFIYMHMLQRFVFFHSLGKQYYDNQSDIGESLGLTRQTVAKSTKTLEGRGLIKSEKVKTMTQTGLFSSYNYTVFDKYEIYKKKVSKTSSFGDDTDCSDLPF